MKSLTLLGVLLVTLGVCLGDTDDSVVIRNKEFSLVLDVDPDKQVFLDKFSRDPTQLWILEPLPSGRFRIKNVADKQYLDVDGEAKAEAKIITAPYEDSEKQEWYINSQMTIVNAKNNSLALDAFGGPSRHKGSSCILLAHKIYDDNQKYDFKYVTIYNL